MIHWRKVTWYSRLLSAVVLLGVLPALTFYLGRQYEAAVSPRVSAPSVMSRVTPALSLQAVLARAAAVNGLEIDEETVISGRLRGFYKASVEEHGGDEVVFGTSSCDTFVVASGDGVAGRALESYFRGLVLKGNTVNRLAESGSLQMHINLSRLSAADKASLLASSKASPVTLNVRKKPAMGRGALACESFVDTLGVEVPPTR